MKKFTLTSSYYVEIDSECNVCLRPSDVEIADFICTYRTYADEASAIADIPSFITQMTPILFDQFKAMDNVPLEIRNQFEL